MVKRHISALVAALLLVSNLRGAEVQLGPEVPVATPLQPGKAQVEPQVALSPAGVVTVWAEGTQIRGALNGAAFAVDQTDVSGEWVDLPGVAAGRQVLLVAWWRNSPAENRKRLFARRFDFSGHPLDEQPFVLDAMVFRGDLRERVAPSIAFNGTHFLVAWSRGAGSSTAPNTVQSALIGEEGAPGPTQETFAAAATGDFAGLASMRVFWWNDNQFFVVYAIEHVGHAGGIYTFWELAALHFNLNNSVLSSPTLLLYPMRFNPNAVNVTLVGTEHSAVWIDDDSNVRGLEREQRFIAAQAAGVYSTLPDIVWNGAELVAVWLDVPFGTLTGTLRAIRLAADIRPIDAEPFDVATQVPYDAAPSLVAAPPGTVIAYSRDGRVYLRTLAALPFTMRPDLIVDGPVTVTPKPADAGKTVKVRYRIRNVGSAAAGATITRVSIASTHTIVAEKDFATGIIPAGAADDEERELTLSTAAAGDYTVTVSLDVEVRIAQSDHTNDSSRGTLTVSFVACSFRFQPVALTLPAAGGPGSVQLIANDQSCNWSLGAALRGGEWLTVRAVTGRGDGVVTVSAPANPSTTHPRTATLVVGDARIVITQAASARGRAVGH